MSEMYKKRLQYIAILALITYLTEFYGGPYVLFRIFAFKTRKSGKAKKQNSNAKNTKQTLTTGKKCSWWDVE